jgi:tight adherence protein B
MVGAAAGIAVLAPVPALVAGAVVALGWGVRRVRRREPEPDVALLADLTALALGAGLPALDGLREAARHADEESAAEVRSALRTARSGGVAALRSAEGRSGALLRALASAAGTGAPVLPAVEAFAAAERHRAHAGALAAARRLPIRLLLPLALLILPGFVLLAVGPALLDAVSRLSL